MLEQACQGGLPRLVRQSLPLWETLRRGEGAAPTPRRASTLIALLGNCRRLALITNMNVWSVVAAIVAKIFGTQPLVR